MGKDQYVAATGIDVKTKRYEAGDTITDLSPSDVATLLSIGAIIGDPTPTTEVIETPETIIEETEGGDTE